MLAELGIATFVVLVPLPVPALVVLMILATLSLGVRGASWLETAAGDVEPLKRLGIGLAIGVPMALALHHLMGPGSVSMLLLGGDPRALTAGLFVALATSLASEMVFRGYIVSSMHTAWGPVGAQLGVGVGALLSVLALGPSSPAAVTGALMLSLGYGFLYLAGRHSVVLPGAVHLCLLAQPMIYEFAGW